ncbi:UPF0182 family protein [Micromonospora sp. PPF5-17]|uniref:UPF0182 protein EFE23_08325 n=2 Tax=Micromonosporaceae TaxID=28056 RepID=A0ABX9WIM0_9ACTN|nr:UPF0182 family protein [Micromonospora sp. PPF5-17B]NES36170.1 UPF0182 family protein [Micromonospora solifontis]NES56727.1 UPF0182 family protein [Micromonospora sp. PPF5-6]RNL99920.1 UPF0182 family protein [Micromonospora solifontis]
MSRRGRVTIGVLIGVFVLFTLLGWGVNAWTDWLWFDEVRYTRVFTGVLTTRLLLFLLVGLGMALVIAVNLWLAHRLRPQLRPHSPEQATLERYRMLLSPRLGTWIAVASVVIGLFAGLSAQSRWSQWLLFRNGGSFGVKDPEFGVDVGFYVFQLPFWRYLLGVAFTAVVLSLLGALAMHYVFGGVRLQGVGDRMTNAARAHLSTLIAVFVLLKAVAYVLDRRAMLLEYNEGAKLYGAGYADVNALLPAKEILAYISVVVAIAIIVFSNAVMRNLVWPGIALALLGVSAVAIGGIYPWAVQTFEVKPSARDKEAPYIQRSIEATRAAFGLTDTKSAGYPASNLTPPGSLATDTSVVQNVRLLDPQLVSETYTQLQQVRGFYDFGPKLDIDRYTVGGKTGDYVVGVREINYGQLTAQQSNWINRHTVYTHGYGLVAAPANQVCNGLPYFVSGFLGDTGKEAQGCSSSTDQIPAQQPRIYYGERMEADDYAIVGQTGDRNVEFDRPTSTGGEQYYTYTGEGGVEIGSFGRRLLYAIKEQESNFLLSEAVNDNSKLLYVRNPRDRVEKVAPFLTVDGDPYPAMVNGRIQWIIDGYTTAATYPYAERVNLQAETADELTGRGTFQLARENVNYIRNSVKATVDAYDGTVRLYAFDENDPVLKAWNKAFGGDLVQPKADIPPELAAHFRYPSDLFKVQRNLLTRFHVTDPGDFYSGQDFWQVPNVPDAPDSGQKQPPYYLYTQFPGQDEGPRFQLTSAVTPNGRQNLAALISGSYVAGEPRLEVLELPDQTRTAGPVQVHQQMINTNSNIRQQLNLLSSGNQAQVQYGNLLSLPFGDGMLYVEPVYVKSNTEKAFPQLQKVLLSYGDGASYVVLADNLADGIKQLVEQGKRAAAGSPPSSGGTTPPPGGTSSPALTGELAQAADRVQTAIGEVKAAQASGDFERYGRALKALDEAMTAFQEAQAAANPSAAPAPSGSPSASPPTSPSASPNG